MQVLVEPKQSRVLVVDDDTAVLRTYARILRSAELEVMEAQDGTTAIDMMRKYAVDVVVSDIAMPILSGFDLLMAVRKHDLDVPVILLTGSPKLDGAMLAVEHGAFRYLAKPVDRDDFVAAVSQATRVRKLAKIKRHAACMLNPQDHQLGDKNALNARLNSALDSLWMAYQPIVSWSQKRVFAYEALVRCAEPTLASPPALLDAAERLGRLADVADRIQSHVATTMERSDRDAVVFVNLHVRDLLDEGLYAPGAPLDTFAERVVLEVTERASLHEVPDVHARVARLREKGYRIAVDDLGAGYAGLSTFTQLEPEVVKLDMMLVRDIDTQPTKQKLVHSMAILCAEMGAQVVAEGIETEAEARTVIALGCDLLQGYYFGRPGKPFPAPKF